MAHKDRVDEVRDHPRREVVTPADQARATRRVVVVGERLPEDIDVEKAAASMKNGVLTIRLPKLAASRMKKVKVSS